MRRLDAIMGTVGGNTYVTTINDWRDRGLEAEYVQEITRQESEPKARTAKELLEYLVNGSPTTRLALQEVLSAKVIEEVDKERYHQHQKLIIGESTPANAWFMMLVLRALLIDARVLHAGLSNKAKADLVDLFNDPASTLKVLIIQYDVGGYGLNCWIACNRVFLASLGRSQGQEFQTAGRCLRVSLFYSHASKVL